MQEFIVTVGEEGQKLGNFVKKKLPEVGLSSIYKVFRKKDVKVNGVRKDQDYIVKREDHIQIYLPSFLCVEENKSKIKRVPITFEVIYEDELVMIVNKPAGLLTVEDKEEKYKTLANQVISYYLDNGLLDDSLSTFVPVPVHRLDRNTSGLVIIAKAVSVANLFRELFKSREGIEKSYLALVKGVIKEPGEIDLALLKDPKTNTVKVNKDKGLSAMTIYSPAHNYRNCTLLNVVILTGRTHQIRVHLSAIGAPIIGDAKYGDFALNKQFKQKYNYENQFLHAGTLRFTTLPAPLEYLSYREFNAPLNMEQSELLEKLK